MSAGGRAPEYQWFLDGTHDVDDDAWVAAMAAAARPGPTVPRLARSEAYLAEHWIDLAQLTREWLPRLEQVVRPVPPDYREVEGEAHYAVVSVGPEMGFAPDMRAVAWHAGAPLWEGSYAALEQVMAAAGDEQFALLERPHHGVWPDREGYLRSRVPLYRLRFPASSSWTDLNSDRDDLRSPLEAASSTSGDLFTLGREDYVVLGDSASWALVYRGGAMSGQCVLGVRPHLADSTLTHFGPLLARGGAPEVLQPHERLTLD